MSDFTAGPSSCKIQRQNIPCENNSIYICYYKTDHCYNFRVFSIDLYYCVTQMYLANIQSVKCTFLRYLQGFSFFYSVSLKGFYRTCVTKTAKSNYQLLHVSLCIRQYALKKKIGSYWTELYEYLILCLEKLSENFKFNQNLTRITGTLQKYHYAFMIISCRISLRMRNISDKSCRKNQNTHFIFNNLFRKSYRLWANV